MENKIKVLVADDEYIIREGIASSVAKNESFEVIALCKNGEQALEQAVLLRPDVCLVDINMPFMNGLAFIEALAKQVDDVIIVIISGYDDFNYAKKAINLGVMEYLLKPINENDFANVLATVKEEHIKKKEKQALLKWSNEQLEKNYPLYLNNFVKDWLENRLTLEEIQHSLRFFKLNLPDTFMVTLFRLKCNTFDTACFNENNLYIAAEKMIREAFDDLTFVLCLHISDENIIIITNEIAEETVLVKINTILQKCEMLLQTTVFYKYEYGQTAGNFSANYRLLIDDMGQDVKCSQLIRDAISYIDNHLMEINFSLQTVSKQLSVSPQYLCRVFKNDVGMTVMDYITKAKMRRAVEMLHDADLKIYEISDRLGYSTQHYFANCFRNFYGVTPTQFKKIIGKHYE